MPTVAVRLTPDQAAWLDAQTKPFHGKSDVVRDLIDSARLSLASLTGGSKLPAYCVGAGTSDNAPTSRLESSQTLPAEEVDTAESASAPKEDCPPLEPKKNKTKNKGRKVLSYPLEFEEFWALYQSLPVKAGKQSKPLALKEWQAACDEVRPQDLLRSVQMAMDVQHAELRSPRGFTVAMPDCFRWLRDCCYLALLEGHQTRQPELIIPGQTVL